MRVQCMRDRSECGQAKCLTRCLPPMCCLLLTFACMHVHVGGRGGPGRLYLTCSFPDTVLNTSVRQFVNPVVPATMRPSPKATVLYDSGFVS